MSHNINNPASTAVATDTAMADVIAAVGFPWVSAIVMVYAVAGVPAAVAVLTAVVVLTAVDVQELLLLLKSLLLPS